MKRIILAGGNGARLQPLGFVGADHIAGDARALILMAGSPYGRYVMDRTQSHDRLLALAKFTAGL